MKGALVSSNSSNAYSKSKESDDVSEGRFVSFSIGEGDCLSQLFPLLFKLVGEKGAKVPFLFPDTILYEHHFPRAWFYFEKEPPSQMELEEKEREELSRLKNPYMVLPFRTSTRNKKGTHHGGGDIHRHVLLRRGGKECDTPSIRHQFSSTASRPIAAHVVSRNKVTGQLDVRCVDDKGLNELLVQAPEQCLLSRSVASRNIFQDVLVASWTPNVFSVEHRVCLCPLHDHNLPIQQRGDVFNVTCFKEVQCCPMLATKVREQMLTFVQCVEKYERLSVLHFRAFFTPESTNRIWFLFADVLKLGPSKTGPAMSLIPEYFSIDDFWDELERERRVKHERRLQKSLAGAGAANIPNSSALMKRMDGAVQHKRPVGCWPSFSKFEEDVDPETLLLVEQQLDAILSKTKRTKTKKGSLSNNSSQGSTTSSSAAALSSSLDPPSWVNQKHHRPSMVDIPDPYLITPILPALHGQHAQQRAPSMTLAPLPAPHTGNIPPLTPLSVESNVRIRVIFSEIPVDNSSLLRWMDPALLCVGSESQHVEGITDGAVSQRLLQEEEEGNPNDVQTSRQLSSMASFPSLQQRLPRALCPCPPPSPRNEFQSAHDASEPEFLQLLHVSGSSDEEDNDKAAPSFNSASESIIEKRAQVLHKHLQKTTRRIAKPEKRGGNEPSAFYLKVMVGSTPSRGLQPLSADPVEDDRYEPLSSKLLLSPLNRSPTSKGGVKPFHVMKDQHSPPQRESVLRRLRSVFPSLRPIPFSSQRGRSPGGRSSSIVHQQSSQGTGGGDDAGLHSNHSVQRVEDGSTSTTKQKALITSPAKSPTARGRVQDIEALLLANTSKSGVHLSFRTDNHASLADVRPDDSQRLLIEDDSVDGASSPVRGSSMQELEVLKELDFQSRLELNDLKRRHIEVLQQFDEDVVYEVFSNSQRVREKATPIFFDLPEGCPRPTGEQLAHVSMYYTRDEALKMGTGQDAAVKGARPSTPPHSPPRFGGGFMMDESSSPKQNTAEKRPMAVEPSTSSSSKPHPPTEGTGDSPTQHSLLMQHSEALYFLPLAHGGNCYESLRKLRRVLVKLCREEEMRVAESCIARQRRRAGAMM